MIRLSAGTASCLGFTDIRMDAYPTTAYFLSGDHCLMKCGFCSQGVDGSRAINRLGRITWPEYTWREVLDSLAMAEEKGVRRICLQSVRHAAGIDTLLGVVDRIQAASRLPLSVSAWIGNKEEAVALTDAGVERISISLDVVNAESYKKIKGGSLQNRLKLLLDCARSLPGRISTHIICGLGETEAEVLSLIDRLIQADVTVALFAFIPLRGTPLEEARPPAIDSYRRVQAGYYLLREKLVSLSSFTFQGGCLISFGLPENELTGILADGKAFQTSGCPGCNRPYYNERPGEAIYNYHRPLSESESKEALLELMTC